MIEEVKVFLDRFFEAEQSLLVAYNKKNLENYNESVDKVDTFSTEKLRYAFGAKLNKLRDDEFYERVKNWPTPEKRFLFRIDEYLIPSGEKIWLSFVSDINPDGWLEYHNFFIVRNQGEELKICSRFTLSDRGMGGDKKWYYRGGDEAFMKEVDEEFLLDKSTLGKQIEINRLIEPSDDEDSMKEYNKD